MPSVHYSRQHCCWVVTSQQKHDNHLEWSEYVVSKVLSKIKHTAAGYDCVQPRCRPCNIWFVVEFRVCINYTGDGIVIWLAADLT